MSKVINASCVASVVTADSFPVPGATILSQGTKASTGVLVIEEDKKTYLTSNAADLAKAIEDLTAILTSVIAILTAHDAVTTVPGASAAAIASLTTLKTAFGLTKDILK